MDRPWLREECNSEKPKFGVASRARKTSTSLLCLYAFVFISAFKKKLFKWIVEKKQNKTIILHLVEYLYF